MKRGILLRLGVLVAVLSLLPLALESQQPAGSSGNVTPQENSTVPTGDEELATFESEGISLFQTVKLGGPLMIPILLLALLSLTLIIERTIYLLRSKSYHRDVLSQYLNQVADKSAASYREELEDELRDEAQLFFNKMEKGLALLNGAGNLAPLLGFFGTVVGMIQAFADIAAATTVNAKVVAVGIQVALVTTAGGLAIAVPTLAAVHFFNHIVTKSYAQSDEIIAELGGKMRRISQGD